VLAGRVSHLTHELQELAFVPLRVHARYSRIEILAACGVGEGARTIPWQSGVHYVDHLPADLLAFTLDKTKGRFSPTTRYRDYAISRDLIHWESQSTTRADSDTGRRYQEHARIGSHVLLFARLNTSDRAFHFLGPATYVSHQAEPPMAATWRLHYTLPGDLFQTVAPAVPSAARHAPMLRTRQPPLEARSPTRMVRFSSSVEIGTGAVVHHSHSC